MLVCQPAGLQATPQYSDNAVSLDGRFHTSRVKELILPFRPVLSAIASARVYNTLARSRSTVLEKAKSPLRIISA